MATMPGAGAPPSGGGGPQPSNFFVRRLGPLPMWLWVVMGVGTVFVVQRMRSGSSSTAAGGMTQAQVQAAQANPNLLNPYGGYTQVDPSAQYDLDNLMWMLTGGQTTGVTQGTVTSPSPGNGTGTTNSPGNVGPTVSIGGDQYVDIGVVPGDAPMALGSPIDYNGEQVAGGVPVFYGSVAGGISQGGPGSNADYFPGANVYVPAQYEQLIWGGSSGLPNPMPTSGTVPPASATSTGAPLPTPAPAAA